LASSVGNASGGTSIDNERPITGSLVAQFAKEVVNNGVTASGKFAVGSTSIWAVGIESTVIALLSIIDNPVTAHRKLAGGSATAPENIAVIRSIVASLSGIESSVTAFSLAGRGALVTVDCVSIITSLPSINNAITAHWVLAVESASIGCVLVIGSVVTLFLVIPNAITAEGHAAVGSASVGKEVVVARSAIALLASFNNTISASNLASLALDSVQRSIVTFLSGINH